MLNFKNTNIALALAIGGLIAADLTYGLPGYSYGVLAAGYLALLFYGSYCIGSQFYMPAICSVATSEKKIAISFDDGPLPEYTPEILRILQSRQVPATFFCIGKNAQAHPELLRQLAREGHGIGSHSYYHGFWFDLLSKSAMLRELKRLHALVQNQLGLEIKWFRPPYGVTTPNLKRAVAAMGYTTVGWSVRSMDTVTKDQGVLLRRLRRALRPGAIFLFHDTVPITAAVLPAFIDYAHQQGYRILSLENLLNLPHDASGRTIQN